jgi:hypothetical protein
LAKSSIFSAKSTTTANIAIKITMKKKEPKNFLRIYLSNILSIDAIVEKSNQIDFNGHVQN